MTSTSTAIAPAVADAPTTAAPATREPKPGETWTFTGVVERLADCHAVVVGRFTKTTFVAEAAKIGDKIQTPDGCVKTVYETGAKGTANSWYGRNFRVLTSEEAATIEAEQQKQRDALAAKEAANRKAAVAETVLSAFSIEEIVGLLVQAREKKVRAGDAQ